jgi:glycosyltransferase involved in cell wall biosynthesis
MQGAATPSAAADLERIARSPRPRLLFVTHAFGGGVRRHIDELAACIADDAEVLLLQPALPGRLALRWLRAGETLAVWPEAALDWEALVALLRALGVDRVHVHHVHGFPIEVLDLPARLDCPCDVTLHDHFPLCPEYHLTDGNGRYCGGEPGCQRCLGAGPAQWPLTIDAWRARFEAFLAAADRVIAPSRDCVERVRRFLPSVSPVCWPHARHAAVPSPAPLRVLVPGALSPAKGMALLEACVRDAAARGLPLHFRVLGYTARPLPHWAALPFSLTGEFPEGRLAELIALERGDVVFFPAQCPETFSYTLSDALDSGLPIVATDLGALPERLAGREGCRLVRWDAPASAVNDALLASAPLPSERAAPAEAMTFEAYRALYAERLPAAPRARGDRIPAIPARWLEAPVQVDPPTTTLAWLFDDAILCGRASSLEKLARRASEADHDLAHSRLRLARIESSRSWRLTGPLRALARWTRSR